MSTKNRLAGLQRIIFLTFFLFFFFFLPVRVFAVTRTWDGGGTDGTCGGSVGDGNKWSCAANWSSDTLPTSADDAVFNSTSTKNATIDGNIEVKGISINSGYTGTITQASGAIVKIRGDGFSQSAGTFSGGDSGFLVGDTSGGFVNSSFSISGGTFTPTSGSFTVTGNFTSSGGSLNMSGKTLTFNGSTQTSTLTCSGNFGGTVGINKTSSSGSFTLASGCNINLATTISGPSSPITVTNNGTMTVASSLTMTSINLVNNGTFTHNGTTWTSTSSSITNNTGATITYAGTDLNISRSFTQNGTFDLTGKTVTFDDNNNSDSTTLTCGSTFQGSIFIEKNNSGTSFSLGSDCTVSGTFNRDQGLINNPVTMTTLTVQGDFINHGTDTFGGSNLSVVLTGSTATNLASANSTAFTSPLTINKSGGGTVALSTGSFRSSGSAATCTLTSGILDVSGGAFDFVCGSTLTIKNGTTIKLLGGGTTITTPVLEGGSTVMYVGTGGPYTLRDWSYQNLTINGPGGTYGTLNTLSIAGNFTLSDGNFTAPSDTLTLTGNFAHNGGTFNHNHGTILLNGNDQTILGTTTFNNFQKAVTSAATLTFDASGKQTFVGDLRLNGAPGNLLSLRSSSPGTQWQIDPQAGRLLSYLDVKDSKNTNSDPIIAGTGSVDSGNNTNWSFTGASFVNFSLDSPGDNSYISNERPDFRWRASSSGAISSYKLNIDNGDGDFSIDNIPATGTSDIITSKYMIHYENFSDSDATNNYISVMTKSSPDWNSGQNDAKLKEGKRTWSVTAKDNSGNNQLLQRTVFLDTTGPVLNLEKINDYSVSASIDSYSAYSTKPTISGRVTDYLLGEVGKKAASGPQSLQLSLEKQNFAGGYDVYSLENFTLTDSFFTSNGQKIDDNSQNDSDKYSLFSFTPSDPLTYGSYRVTLTAKDKAGNTSGNSVAFYLTIGSYSQIITPEENKYIEQQIEKKFPNATPEEKNKLKQQLNVVKPTAVNKSSPLQNFFSQVGSGILDFFSKGVQSIQKIRALTSYAAAKIPLFISQVARKITPLKTTVSKIPSEDPFKEIKNKLAVTVDTLSAIWLNKEPTRITEVKVLTTGKDYAVIYWKTNQYTNNNKVNYGETRSYGSQAFAPDEQKEHKVKLTHLKSGVKYLFEVMSQGKNYTYDSFHEFTTAK